MSNTLDEAVARWNHRTPAQCEQQPTAFVPVHRRQGPLWSDTFPAGSDLQRSENYPRMPLYAAPPQSALRAWTDGSGTWQTVPLPATAEMLVAADRADAEMRAQGFANAETEALYYAMLDAAPPYAPPQAAGSAEQRKALAEDWRRQIINAGGDESVAQQAVALAALNGLFDHVVAVPQTAREWPDVAGDDSDVIRAAHAIAEHGIGRPWNDFLPTNAYDVDHGDLIEYGRAAVAALRAASQSQAESAPPQAAVMREALEECLTVLELFQHMSSASASWRKYLERKGMPLGSGFVAGPCHATVLLALQKVRAALSLPAP